MLTFSFVCQKGMRLKDTPESMALTVTRRSLYRGTFTRENPPSFYECPKAQLNSTRPNSVK